MARVIQTGKKVIPVERKRELWVAGSPSFYGGADTELDHNIDLWRLNDVEVNIVPLFDIDNRMMELCEKRGCVVHKYRPNIFKDKLVVCFCNTEFLSRLSEIMHNGKPRSVVWFNCMTFTLPNELEAHKNGWFDVFGFVSKYQKSYLEPIYVAHRPITELVGYRPYFNIDNISQGLKFSYHPPEKWFAMGRVSRDDGTKFPNDLWNIFYKVCAPVPTKTFVLGFGENAIKVTGPPPQDGLDWQTWTPNAIPVRELYEQIHVLIHKTGGSRESYCRIVPECYASGVPVVVEDDYAFPELVVNGETGYRCKSSDEMSYRASELAFDEEKRKRFASRGYDFLRNQICSPDECWKAWKAVL